MKENYVIRTVAVLDDNDDDREMTVMAVEAAGYEVFLLPKATSLDDAVSLIRQKAQALVSDHNLDWGEGALFTGAEIVSLCFSAGIPAVLVTGYMMDSNTTIRSHRRTVPELVSRSELDGDRLRTALENAQAELLDRPPRSRVPHRALVRVERVNPDTKQIDVVVPQWDPRQKVAIPVSLFGGELPENLRDLLDHRFIATVNTGAESSNDLYFTGFEPAGPVPLDADIE